MRIRVLYTAILACFLSLTAFAQQELHLTVLDKDSRQPVPFAYVNTYIDNILKKTVQTDEEGNVTVTPNPYPYAVRITISGYESYELRCDSPVDKNSFKIFIQKKFSTLNEVVVTGVVQPVKLKDALSNYQVIPRSVIEAQGAATLNDVLNKQLNMSVGGNDDILGPSIRMQGMGGDKVKILMDGMPVNGREAGNINLAQISMNNVERIEIIQGPMSVIYGTDAMGGTINIISKKEQKPFGFHAGTLLSSVNRYNVDASTTFAIKKRSQVTIGAGRNFFEGWKNIDQPLSYHGDTINTSRCFLFKPNEQLLANVGYGYVAPSHFRLQFASDLLKDKITDRGSLRTWDPFSGALATDNYFYTYRLNNRLSLQGDLGKSGHWISQNSFAYYHRIHNTINKDMVSMQQNLTTNKGDQDTTSSYDYSFRSGYSNVLYKLKYTIGYDINLQYFNSLKLLGRTNYIQDYAAYADLSYPVIANVLTANAGIRGAYNTRLNAPVVPAFNILFTPIKKLQVRGSYAQGYRAPSLKEMYLDFVDINHDVHGNDKLKAENSKHMQLSASYQALEDRTNYLQLIATGFYNDVYNQITLVKTTADPEDNRYDYQNFAHLQNVIGNLQADGQYRNLHLIAGYSYVHALKAGNNFTAFNATEVTATLQYYWRYTGINFNVFYKYTGRQPFLSVDLTGVASYNGQQAAYSICDASFEKKLFKKKLQVIAGVKNIFDIQTAQVSGATQVSGPHGGGGSAGNMLPRSMFTSLSLNID